MGCFDVFCTFCGGPLNTGYIWDSLRSRDPKPGGAYWDYNENLLCDEDVEWLRDIRLVAEWQNKADQDRHTDVAAKVYHASEFDAGMAMLDATDAHGVTHWCYAFAKYENEDNYKGTHYVMHSACLLIVQRWMYEEEKSIQDLYNALCVYDEPGDDFTGLYLPNRHYGAEDFWEQEWLAKQGWEFTVKDPVNVTTMTQYILSKLRPVLLEDRKQLENDSSARTNAYSLSSEGSIMQRLPAECFEQICTYLPLASILALRLSCRNFTSRTPMDQDFYRKRLLSGQLLALHDLDLALVRGQWDEIKDKDWRHLVRTLARYENFQAGEDGSGALGELHDAPIGLKNRMRIVKIVQGIFSGI